MRPDPAAPASLYRLERRSSESLQHLNTRMLEPAHRSLLQQLKPGLPVDDGEASWTLFVSTSWMALGFMAIRAVADRTLLVSLRRFLAKHGKAKQAEGVWENLYIVVWSIVTEILAVHITLNLNGGCTPWSTDACLSGWPNHRLHVLQKWYMMLMFHFYLHEMLGAMLGQLRMKTDMIVHHIATMGLIYTAYALNLTRYSIMWQALFDTSNPLLHTAKGMHAAGLPQLEGVKWVMFNLFALAFFICRVAAAPFSILWPAFTRSFAVLPKEWALFLIGLMLIVCGIQWVWFYRIVRMATDGQARKAAEAEEDARRREPASARKEL